MINGGIEENRYVPLLFCQNWVLFQPVHSQKNDQKSVSTVCTINNFATLTEDVSEVIEQKARATEYRANF
jgi:hypothetical protein